MLDSNCEPSDKLRAWLEKHTDVLNNPWAGVECRIMITDKSCDGLCVAEEDFEDTSPLPAQCVVIDPLHGRESDYVSCTKRSGKEAIAVSVKVSVSLLCYVQVRGRQGVHLAQWGHLLRPPGGGPQDGLGRGHLPGPGQGLDSR